jgi:hypothetical protein
LAKAQQEIEALKAMLAAAAANKGGGSSALSSEQIASLKAEQEAQEKALKEEIEAQKVAAMNEAKVIHDYMLFLLQLHCMRFLRGRM